MFGVPNTPLAPPDEIPRPVCSLSDRVPSLVKSSGLVSLTSAPASTPSSLVSSSAVKGFETFKGSSLVPVPDKVSSLDTAVKPPVEPPPLGKV